MEEMKIVREWYLATASQMDEIIGVDNGTWDKCESGELDYRDIKLVQMVFDPYNMLKLLGTPSLMVSMDFYVWERMVIRVKSIIAQIEILCEVKKTEICMNWYKLDNGFKID